MYNITRKNNSQVKASFNTEVEAQTYMLAMGPQRNFFKIEYVVDPSEQEVADTDEQDTLFEGAVRITRQNVKHFYHKEGLIKVFSPNGKLLHTGKTTNMGKVFSNYVNCARYNQSYDFDIDGGDILMFKEQPLKS